MYLPSHFAESRSEVMHALMQAHPFATLVTQGGMGLSADHLPLHLAAAIGPFGALQGHVARANPLWRNAADSEVLAIFQGPQAYVTPSWYEPSAPTARRCRPGTTSWSMPAAGCG
jgi:transcriptional regulator